MPQVVQSGRFANLLRRVFGTRGYLGLSLIDDLMPMLSVFEGRSELFWLRGERLMRATSDFTAAAGNLPTVGITVREPDPVSIVVVEAVTISVATTTEVRIGLEADPGTADLGSTLKDLVDARDAGIQADRFAIFNEVTGAAMLQEGGAYLMTPNTQLRVPVRYVLVSVPSNPQALKVQAQAIGGRVVAVFEGYQYTAMPEELQRG